MMKKPTKLNRIQIAGLEDLPIQIWYMESLQKYGPANHAHCRFVETDAEALMTHSLDAITNIEIKTKFRRLYEERFSGSNITTSELRFAESQQLLNITSMPIKMDGAPEARLFFAQPISYSAVPYATLPIPDDLMQASLAGMGAGLWHWNVKTGETVFDEKWAEMLGYTLEELSPISIQTWEELTHPDDLKMAGELLTQHFEGKTAKYDAKLRMKHKDGHWLWIHDRGSVYQRDQDGSTVLMAGTHVDISERQHLSEMLDRQTAFQWLASKFSASLLQSPAEIMDDSIESGLGQIGQFLNTDRVYVFAFNYANETMDNSHEWVAEGVSPEKENLREVPWAAFPWWMDKLLKDETIYIPDTAKIPSEQADLKEILEMQSIKSLIVVPIVGREGVIGFWGLDFVKDFWIFDEFSHQVLRFISSIISGALESTTDQQRILGLLQQSRTSFRKIADQTQSIILTTNLDQHINYFNTAFSNIYGYVADDILGKHPAQVLMARVPKPRHEMKVSEALKKNGKWTGYFLNLTKKNELIIESAVISPLIGPDDLIVGYIKIAENVTTRMKNEEWLNVLNIAHQLSVTVKSDFAALMPAINQVMAKDIQLMVPQHIFFLPLENLNLDTLTAATNHPELARRILADPLDPDLVLRDDIIRGNNDMSQIVKLGQNEPCIFDKQHFFKEYFSQNAGEIIFAEVSSEPTCYGIIAMVHGYDMSYFDKTDTDNLNSLGKILGVALGEIEISRLMLSQNRQEQISQLASGLAHEVRNPLAVISIGLELLARKLDMNDEIVQKAFSNIENSVERANSIVENLMRLAVPDDQETALSRVNLHSVLSEAIALVSFHVRQKDIKLNLKSSQTLYVLGSKEGLLKVFVNLYLNAIQALDRGGRIEIMTQETESEEISIAIKDNGPGIPEQDLGRVLTPFFSTKKDNHGSGMGLYICTEIIQRFQGSLIISNNPDAGVMVQIILKQG